jgi:predicted extracellular nuclease
VRSRAEAWFDERPGFRRAPLFQSFDGPGYGFTLGVVHLKSKRCDGRPEIISSEGCGEPVRSEEAALLVDGARALALSEPLEPLLLLGDYNGDSLEAPLLALRDAGFVDLLDGLPAADRYSYVFEGRASLLDHALAGNGAARLARGAAIWHINADEPFFRGYSLDNPPAEYHPDARRSSDHDPIIVDLAL